MTTIESIESDIDSVDLADPAVFTRGGLAGFWRTLRDTRPVHWNSPRGERPGFWALSRYEDIMTVYRDNVVFTSEQGNVLVTLLAGADPAGGKMLAVTDGHRHRELRKVLLRAFSPRVLHHVAKAIRRNTRELMREAMERGDCDFALEIASRIPMTTISDLLDVPREDRDFLLKQTKLALSADGVDVDELDSEMARNEILLYFGELIERRRQHPGEDVISVLANSTIDGVHLSDEDVTLNCYSLIVGGDPTSRLSMIDSVRTLASFPEQWRRLKHGECTIDTAVDEVLRWASPTLHFGRTAVHEVTIHDVHIAAGDIVTLWHAAGNQDERIFPAPEVFDLSRTPNKHLAFGYGPHFCIGSHLARIEIAELLMALRDFAIEFRPNGEALRIYSNLLTGFSSLPMRFIPDHDGLARADD